MQVINCIVISSLVTILFFTLILFAYCCDTLKIFINRIYSTQRLFALMLSGLLLLLISIFTIALKYEIEQLIIVTYNIEYINIDKFFIPIYNK